MKVLEITNVDFSLRHFLLPLMRGIRARGHEVVGVCADGPLLAVVRAEGFRVAALPFARSLSPMAQARAFRTLLALLRAEKPDLVHGHMPISGFLARLAARVAGVPRVAYTCHGFLFNQPGPWWRRALAFAMEWTGGRLTDVFLTVSAEEAGNARRWWIARGAKAVGNGRDPARFHPDLVARAAIRRELGTAEGTVVVVAVSRLVRHKGYPELLAAMADVDAELWVVGERLASDHGEDMEPYFVRAGLGARLKRLGYREDVPAILAAADIFALPSHFEGLPMSIIEAMLTGLPVVATNVRGPREQVIEGETGLLVPPADSAGLAKALQLLCSPSPLAGEGWGEGGQGKSRDMSENLNSTKQGAAATPHPSLGLLRSPSPQGEREYSLRSRMGRAGRIRALAQYDEARVVARTLDLLGL